MRKREALRELRRLQAATEAAIEIQINGVTVLGPVSLATLAAIIRWGGYRPGDDLLSEYSAPAGAGIRLLVTPH